MLENIDACELCGEPTGASLIMTKHGLAYVQCPKCTLVWSNPRLPENEYSARLEALGCSEADSDRSWQGRVEQGMERAAVVIQRLGISARILDFGCGDGAFLAAATRAGLEAVGLERSSTVAETACYRGLTVIKGDVLTLTPPSTPFDGVTLWDVIEHLCYPRKTLRRLLDWLRPGGLLFIQTPNCKGVSARLRGDKWWVYGPTDHLFMFSQATLQALLERVGMKTEVLYTQDLCPWNPPELQSHAFPVRLYRQIQQSPRSMRLLTRLDLGDWLYGIFRKI